MMTGGMTNRLRTGQWEAKCTHQQRDRKQETRCRTLQSFGQLPERSEKIVACAAHAAKTGGRRKHKRHKSQTVRQ
jgi:hypothetical protein